MERLDRTATRALRLALDAQPATPAKVSFAWTIAAGPALARAASVSWADGVLHVQPKSEEWRREVARARPVILARLADLLGPDVVRRLSVSDPPADR